MGTVAMMVGSGLEVLILPLSGGLGRVMGSLV